METEIEIAIQVEAALQQKRQRQHVDEDEDESGPARLLVAITGLPGSGKSTVARALHARQPASAMLPMDGYHLPKALLDAEGLRRRGAPQTFDAARLRRDLQRLRAGGGGSFPDFDHAEGDPRENAIRIDPEARPIFVEGLYLLLREWEMEALFDLRIYLECPLEVALARVAARHVACGLAPDAAAARARVEANDRCNAELIVADGCRDRADMIIPAQ